MDRDHAFRERAAEFASRAFIGILYAQLSVRLFGDFIRTQHLTALLLLVSESLVVVFTIFRRRALTVDRSSSTRLVTAIAVVGPALLHPIDDRGLVPDPVTAVFVALGAFVVIAAKMTLGRSFGIAPANRGIVATGPYSLVRHPIYAGYLVTHVAFLAGSSLRHLSGPDDLLQRVLDHPDVARGTHPVERHGLPTVLQACRLAAVTGSLLINHGSAKLAKRRRARVERRTGDDERRAP